MIALLAVLACNTAPLDYRQGMAPRALSSWFEPSDDFCEQFDDDPQLIDGFLWCGMSRGTEVIAVDDPVYVPCADVPEPEKGQTALTVFDGVMARAYPLELMMGRELVHDDWRGEPLLVDF